MSKETFWSWALPGYGVSTEQARLDWETFREVRKQKDELAKLAKRLREVGH